jgi:integrase
MHARIVNLPNVRYRADSRYEWRKTLNGTTHQIIEKDPELFIKKLSNYKKQLKQNGNNTKSIIFESKPKQTHKLIDLLWQYHKLNRVGKIKQSSADRHEDVLKGYLYTLTNDITAYSKNDIQNFLNNVNGHRNAVYCYYNLKNVFADATENGILSRNIIATLKKPPNPVKKGSWVDLDGQRKILESYQNSTIGKEILFYIMTGCRLEEAYNTIIDFDKRIAKVTRTKTEDSGIAVTYIPLSQAFCDIIKDDWHKMFKKHKARDLSKLVTKFLVSIGITGKTTHDLRHTFSSNVYYLGTDPKRHQYLMGHTSIKMTYDTYTTLDLSVTKKDVLNLYGELYPTF